MCPWSALGRACGRALGGLGGPAAHRFIPLALLLELGHLRPQVLRYGFVVTGWLCAPGQYRVGPVGERLERLLDGSF